MRYILTVLLFYFAQALYAQPYSLSDLMATPYISNLTAAPGKSTLLFTANQQGKRNLFMVEGAGKAARQLTQFNEDDGLELTSVSISADGEWAVFVRGGDHGANSAARPTNAASYISPQKIQLYSVKLSTGDIKILGEGDFPLFHPASNKIVFLSRNQPWVVPVDGSEAPKPLFQVSGTVRGMQWSRMENRSPSLAAVAIILLWVCIAKGSRAFNGSRPLSREMIIPGGRRMDNNWLLSVSLLPVARLTRS